MKFIDLNAQYARIEKQINDRIQGVLKHGQFILGPELQEFENRLAEFVGVKHCIGVSSGTDALLVAMMALDIGQGDLVITGTQQQGADHVADLAAADQCRLYHVGTPAIHGISEPSICHYDVEIKGYF